MKSRGVLGYVLLGLGFIFCPCHLAITLPLLGIWIGGTTGVNFLTENRGLVFGVSTVLFLVGLGAGWMLLSRGSACEINAAEARKERRYEPQEQG